MSKETPKRSQIEIRKKRKRKEKIKKLKEKYLVAQTQEEKQKIIEKILKIAPHYPIAEILKFNESKK